MTTATALEDLPETLRVEEAAAVLRISRTSAYALARQYLDTDGREGLPVVRLGRSLRVPEGRAGAPARRRRLPGQGQRRVSPPAPAEQREAGEAAGLFVGPASRRLRRALGPMVWAVLEEVTLDARPTGDHLVARTNVRRLAAGLGISKDTAARALARLGDAGLVSRQNTRRQTGRFMASSYVVRLDETSGIAVLADDSCPMDPRPATPDTAARGDGDAPPSSARRSSRPRSSRRRRAAEQSCLFPLSDQREDGQ